MAKQEGLGRPACTRAALIPIRKNAAWWALTQDERRQVFEAQSQHIAIGLRYLPAIARRLHHCRDLGPDEPFDFLTWFEYTPADAGAFEDLVGKLRASPEWRFVEREVDIRLSVTFLQAISAMNQSCCVRCHHRDVRRARRRTGADPADSQPAAAAGSTR